MAAVALHWGVLHRKWSVPTVQWSTAVHTLCQVQGDDCANPLPTSGFLLYMHSAKLRAVAGLLCIGSRQFRADAVHTLCQV